MEPLAEFVTTGEDQRSVSALDALDWETSCRFPPLYRANGRMQVAGNLLPPSENVRIAGVQQIIWRHLPPVSGDSIAENSDAEDGGLADSTASDTAWSRTSRRDAPCVK